MINRCVFHHKLVRSIYNVTQCYRWFEIYTYLVHVLVISLSYRTHCAMWNTAVKRTLTCLNFLRTTKAVSRCLFVWNWPWQLHMHLDMDIYGLSEIIVSTHWIVVNITSRATQWSNRCCHVSAQNAKTPAKGDTTFYILCFIDSVCIKKKKMLQDSNQFSLWLSWFLQRPRTATCLIFDRSFYSRSLPACLIKWLLPRTSRRVIRDGTILLGSEAF